MRVLIAEDDPTARHTLLAILGLLHHEVVETVNGEEAWAALTDKNPPELAILDWMMPRLAGDDLCRRLRARSNSPPLYIIILTAGHGEDGAKQAKSFGADDYMVKPFHVNDLKARIQKGEREITRQHGLLATEVAILSTAAAAPKAALPSPLPQKVAPEIIDNGKLQFSRSLKQTAALDEPNEDGYHGNH